MRVGPNQILETILQAAALGPVTPMNPPNATRPGSEAISRGRDAITGFAARSGNANNQLPHLLERIAPGKAQVSEEDLYAALIAERLAAKHGPEAMETFLRQFQDASSSLRRPDGFVPVEQAAVQALQKMVESGALSQAAAESINAQAFRGAQLDALTDVLFDDRGSESDATRAVATTADALLAAKHSLDRMGMGREPAGRRPLRVSNHRRPSSGARAAAAGGRADGANGFLWKPTSESDGKLVILLPKEMTHDVQSVTLKDAQGRVVDSGKAKGVANGGREHFRFGRAGSDYPPNLTVEVNLRDGSTKQYNIPNPSKRYD